MITLPILSWIAFIFLASTGAFGLDIPTEITLCDASYTYVRPTPAERNSSVGFEWKLSDFNGTASPNLVSRYLTWPTRSSYSDPVSIYRNSTFDRVSNTTIFRSDPSYVVHFDLKPFWNSTWLNLPTAATFERAYVTVTLVANVSQTITSSADNGDVSLVNYLFGANGKPVRASTRKPIYCDQYISPNGSAKDRGLSSGSRTSGSSNHLWAIILPIIIVGGIVLTLIFRCCRWRSPESNPRRGGGNPGFLRRRWQKRQRRRAAEAMDEPTFIDDTEKQAAAANWSGTTARHGAMQPATSQVVPFPMPTSPSTDPGQSAAISLTSIQIVSFSKASR